MNLLTDVLNRVCPVVIAHKTINFCGIQTRYEKTNMVSIKCKEIKEFATNTLKEFKKLF